MLWLADEFLAQVPDGDPVNDVVTALKAYHRGSVADAPRTLADLAGAITLAKVMLEVFEPPRLTEFLEALDTLEEQITAELAQARHAQTVREAYTPAAGSVIQAVTDSAGPSEQAKNAFGRWAGSVSNGRSRVGPMRGLDPDYVSEFASLGFVGKEVGPRVYARWEQDGSPGDFGSWLASEDGRRALIGETIMDSSLRDKHVTYLEPDDLPAYKLHFRGGKFYRGDSQVAFDCVSLGGQEKAIFVLSTNNQFYVHFHDTGRFHHSSFLKGAPVKGAGKMRIANGAVLSVDPGSGHYGPSTEHQLNVVRGLALLMKRADAPEGSPTRHAFAAISVESLRGDASLPAEEFYRQGGFA